MHPNVFLNNFWRLEVRDQIFVAMSFSDVYTKRFNDVIKPAIESIVVNGNMQVAQRVDLSKTGDSILTDIMDGIAHSRMIVADVSTFGYDSKSGVPYRNGNVMYEVGVALATRQPEEVLLLRDDDDKFMFDVSTIPHLKLNFSDVDAAKNRLNEELCARIGAIHYFQDSRVKKAASSLTAIEVRLLKHLIDLPLGQINVVTVQSVIGIDFAGPFVPTFTPATLGCIFSCDESPSRQARP